MGHKGEAAVACVVRALVGSSRPVWLVPERRECGLRKGIYRRQEIEQGAHPVNTEPPIFIVNSLLMPYQKIGEKAKEIFYQDIKNK